MTKNRERCVGENMSPHEKNGFMDTDFSNFLVNFITNLYYVCLEGKW